MLGLLTVLSLWACTTASPVARDDTTTAATAAAPAGTSASSTATTVTPVATIYPGDGEKGVVISGTSYPQFKQDAYLGLPFAAPPINELRFQHPQDYEWTNATYSATTQPPACLQDTSGAGLFGAGGQVPSEDCLQLNILTPEGSAQAGTKLPVFVWVYGGSFKSGSASTYNGTIMMAEGLQTNRPFLFVAINYRLGIFGFPNGQEAAEANVANLGLRDISKSLEWVQSNIAAFGGDPSQVTVAGESAGAILISQLYLNPNQDLFKGAIMESGAQSTSPLTRTMNEWQKPFDLLVGFANCSTNSTSSSSNATSTMAMSTRNDGGGNQGTTNSSSVFDCLRTLSGEQLLEAQKQVYNITPFGSAFVFAPSVDGDVIPDSPHTLLSQGKFAKIPYISGNNLDEGTVFVPQPKAITNETIVALTIAAIEPVPPSQEVLQQLLTEVYPMDPAAGSPFGTGNDTFGVPALYKQVAAVFGDGTFQSSRRYFLEQSVKYGLDKVWTYLFEAPTPSAPPTYGVYHGSEVAFVFGIPIALELGYNATSAAGVTNIPNYTEQDAELSVQMIDYWINFVYYTDPSGGQANGTHWPAYGSDATMLSLNTSEIKLIKDDYRKEQLQFFIDHPVDFNLRRRGD